VPTEPAAHQRSLSRNAWWAGAAHPTGDRRNTDARHEAFELRDLGAESANFLFAPQQIARKRRKVEIAPRFNVVFLQHFLQLYRPNDRCISLTARKNELSERYFLTLKRLFSCR
jgi:hypothetical protein